MLFRAVKLKGARVHLDLSLLVWPTEGVALLVSQVRQGKQPVIYLLWFIYEKTRLLFSPYLIISCTGSLAPQHYILWNSLDVNFFSQLGVCSFVQEGWAKAYWVYIVQLQLPVSDATSQGPWACPDIYLHVSDLQNLPHFQHLSSSHDLCHLLSWLLFLSSEIRHLVRDPYFWPSCLSRTLNSVFPF